MHLREVQPRDLGVVWQHQLALELALVREDRHDAQLGAVEEVVARDVELAGLRVQCDGGGPETTRELVEHARVVDA